MSSEHVTHIEALGEDNFDIWKLQMKALLVKNDAWEYVSGEKMKPETIAGDDASLAATEAWEVADRKAHSDLVLAISPPKLKHIVGCPTANAVWRKLHTIYESARKTTLLKQLLLQKMAEEEDVREHIRKFFKAVDELRKMEVEINEELLTIMLLYSLPPSYENVRCAIETLNFIPKPESIKFEIIDESNERKKKQPVCAMEAKLASGPSESYDQKPAKRVEKSSAEKQEEKNFSSDCYEGRNVGHKAVDCKVNLEPSEKASKVEEMSVVTTAAEESVPKTEETGEEAAVNNNGHEQPKKGRLPGRFDRMGNCGGLERKFHMATAGTYDEKSMGCPNVAEIPLEEALSGGEVEAWKLVIQTEFEALIKNQTWDLVGRPEKQNIIECRIALRNRYNAEGILNRRKAKVVANGYFHSKCKCDPEYEFRKVRLLMAVAVKHNLIVHHLDAANAFLNSDIESEHIYMEVPQLFEEMLPGIISKEKLQKVKVGPTGAASKMLKQIQSGNKVCLMKKPLYGLEQAYGQWYTKLNEALVSFGFQNLYDKYTYFQRCKSEVLIILVCFDDILLISKDVKWMSDFKDAFVIRYSLKDLGRVKYFLGMDFNHGDGSLGISQTRYIEDILREFGMENAKPTATPLDLNMRWLKSGELSADSSDEETESYPLEELMGRLMNLALGTRPDIIYAVTYLSFANISCREKHWIAAKKILRYLRGTSNLGLEYERGTSQFECFYSAPSSKVDGSHEGIVFSLANNAVAWRVRKQGEQEPSFGCSLLRLLNGIGFEEQNLVPVYTNKIDDIVDVDVGLKGYDLSVNYTQSTGMMSDVLNKNLAWPEYQSCLAQLGMSHIDRKKKNVVDIQAKHCL